MDSTLKRTWAEIKLDNLEHNYKVLRERIGADRKFLGVVKADAYGHGAIRVATLLQELGADYLAVSSLDEAVELRLNHITMPIMILGHTPQEEVESLIKYDIAQAVTCRAKALEYNEEAARIGKKLRIHIKVDTGMSRLGFLCADTYFRTGVEGIKEAISLPNLEAEGIFTHFAVSDEIGDYYEEYTKNQFDLFTRVISAVESELDFHFPIRHCANTGAVANYPETWLDMVRPGLLLYGYGDFAKDLGLKPVMTLKTTVSTIKVYPAGTHISYGGIFETKATTRIGVLPYGYADGFFRALSNRCTLMTEEGPAKQRGKICMDMCMLDITGMNKIDVGSEIEIFGEENPIEDLASLASTIPYELTCAVSKRVPRMYIRHDEIIEKELLLRG